MPFCKSCSAPLPPYNAQCEYCGVKNDLNLRGIHEYTVTRPTEDRTCPVCHIPLETIDLHLEEHFYIERCPTCMGLFFDPGELNALLDRSVDHVYRIDRKKLWEMNQMAPRQPGRMITYINCPICGELMNRVNFGAQSGVIIDKCRDGIWVDNGELRKLLEWRKAGGQLHHETLLRQQEEREKRSWSSTSQYAGGLPYSAGSSSSVYSSSGALHITPLVVGAAKALWRLFT